MIIYFFLALYFASTREPLFNSWVLKNNIINWFVETTDKVYQILPLRIVIGFLALILLIRIILRGILSIRLLSYGYFGLPEEENQFMRNFKKNHVPNEREPDEYTDYEELEEKN